MYIWSDHGEYELRKEARCRRARMIKRKRSNRVEGERVNQACMYLYSLARCGDRSRGKAHCMSEFYIHTGCATHEPGVELRDSRGRDARLSYLCGDDIQGIIPVGRSRSYLYIVFSLSYALVRSQLSISGHILRFQRVQH